MSRAARSEVSSELRRRPRRAACSPLLASLAVLTSVACATAPNTLELGLASPIREVASAAALRDAIAAQATPASAPIAEFASGPAPALVVAATPDELIAARLDRSPREARIWRSPLGQGASQPVLTPGLVVVGSELELLGVAPADGRKLWTLPVQNQLLLAAAADARHLALLLADRRGRRAVVAYERQSKGPPRERLRVIASRTLGAPALLAGALLVPWGEGYVSAVDLPTATELARARVGTEPLHALWWGEALFFGGPPWVELTQGGAAPYALPRRPLPGAVLGPLPDSGTFSAPVGAPAALDGAIRADVTRLYVQPISTSADTGTAQRSGGAHYMATYGRIAFGLEREQGALAWVVALPGRALASVAAPGRFIVCDESGGVRVLSAATGQVERFWQLARQRRVALGQPPFSACALAPGALLPADADAPPSAPDTLLEQLAQALALSDPGLSDAQRFLSRELAARPEPEATRALIELVQRHSLARVLHSEAEDLLATRRNGEDYMLAALSESGARGEEPLPPIAPLGEALAALGERRAAPLLARQLNRPAHPASAIARAAAALEQLASEAEYDELSVFFSLHRTSADGPEWVAAVVSSARTLLRIGGPRARTLVEFALRDPLTIPEIQSALERELGASPEARTTPAGSKADLAN